MHASSRSLLAASLVVASAAAVAGSREPVAAIMAEAELSPERALDVGIQVFDPGVPEAAAEELESRGIYEDVRRSEARFVPFHLKRTLTSTGHWPLVRVIPRGAESMDVTVSGEILESNGKTLAVRVRVVDATGRVWRDKKYKGDADPEAYDEEALEDLDPYQSLYNRIANDMLESRIDLDSEEIAEIRDVSRLRFAAYLAPAVFGDYLSVDRKGRFTIERFPAEDDPMMSRIARIRHRDDMFVDTLDEYYDDFYTRMGEPYGDWRMYSFQEQMELQAIRREARKRKIIGALLVVGGAVADGGSSAARVAKDAAVIGGALAIKSGMDKAQEAKIHREALKELAASFDAEIAPLLVDVEGQTLRLEGSAETQYQEWRDLLSRIFSAETGLPLDPNDAAVAASGTAER